MESYLRNYSWFQTKYSKWSEIFINLLIGVLFKKIQPFFDFPYENSKCSQIFIILLIGGLFKKLYPFLDFFFYKISKWSQIFVIFLFFYKLIRKIFQFKKFTIIYQVFLLNFLTIWRNLQFCRELLWIHSHFEYYCFWNYFQKTILWDIHWFFFFLFFFIYLLHW